MTAPSPWRAEHPDLLGTATRRAAEWIASRELRDVLTAFGGHTEPASPRELATWSKANLDARAGRERQVVAAVDWSAEQTAVLIGAAPGLGLVTTAEPVLEAYDHTIVMAGTTTANRLRTELALAIGRSGIEIGAVVGLASARPLPDSERSLYPDAIHDLEWKDLASVLLSAFGADELHPVDGDVIDLAATSADGREVRVLSAPTSDPGRRANSADALSHFATRSSRPLGHVLILTSSIYAPYTFFIAVERLASTHPASVEVIGTPTSTDAPRPLLAQRFAQEINSTLQAIARLHPPDPDRPA